MASPFQSAENVRAHRKSRAIAHRLHQAASFSRNENIETLVAISPDGGYGWVICIAALLVLVNVGIGFSIFGLLLVPMTEDLQFHFDEVALTASIFLGFLYLTGIRS